MRIHHRKLVSSAVNSQQRDGIHRYSGFRVQDRICNVFQFEIFLAVKFTTQHDLYWQYLGKICDKLHCWKSFDFKHILCKSLPRCIHTSRWIWARFGWGCERFLGRWSCVVGLAPDSGERQQPLLRVKPFEGKNVVLNLMVKPYQSNPSGLYRHDILGGRAAPCERGNPVQGYLAHKKRPPP